MYTIDVEFSMTLLAASSMTSSPLESHPSIFWTRFSGSSISLVDQSPTIKY